MPWTKASTLLILLTLTACGKKGGSSEGNFASGNSAVITSPLGRTLTLNSEIDFNRLTDTSYLKEVLIKKGSLPIFSDDGISAIKFSLGQTSKKGAQLLDGAVNCSALSYENGVPTMQNTVAYAVANNLCGDIDTTICGQEAGIIFSAGTITFGIPCAADVFKDAKVTINNGSTSTAQKTVNLTLAYSDFVEKMAISSRCETANQWGQVKKEVQKWNLPSGAGQHFVYAKFKDFFGRSSECVSDSILVTTGNASSGSANSGGQGDSNGTDNGSGTGGNDTGSGGGTETLLDLQTFQRAPTVIGQSLFTTAGSASPSDMNIGTHGSSFISDNVLYVVDGENNRILKFNTIPVGEGGNAASAVLGQVNFTDTGSGNARNQFNNPIKAQLFNGKLAVLDSGNGRVMIWNSIPTTLADADVLVGRSSITDIADCQQDKLGDSPSDMLIADGKLFVADTNNNRIMIWNSIPETDGAAADLVLGQSNFQTCTNNGSNLLQEPQGIWSDGDQIFVADTYHHRVLGWSSFPASNGAAPNFFLGQLSMANTGPSSARSRMNTPIKVTSNGTSLFVADAGNNRVLGWHAIPTSFYALPDFVLGQSNFFLNGSFDDNQTGSSQNVISNRVFGDISDIFADATRLAVYDQNRVLVFNADSSIRYLMHESGDNQVGTASLELDSPIVVSVRDNVGATISGVTVTWSTDDGGDFTGANSVISDNDGLVTANWELGPLMGANTALASIDLVGGGTSTASFSALANAGGSQYKLVFLTQPSDLNSDTSPDVIVAITDLSNNVITSATNAISLSIGSAPGSASLSGGDSRNAIAGIATFDSLKINQEGEGYTLVASSTGFTSTTSNSFNAYSKLVVEGPTDVLSSSCALYKVHWEDGFGATILPSSFKGLTVSSSNNDSEFFYTGDGCPAGTHLDASFGIAAGAQSASFYLNYGTGSTSEILTVAPAIASTTLLSGVLNLSTGDPVATAGSLDPNFGSSGYITRPADYYGQNFEPHASLILPNGKILIAGRRGNDAAITRLNSDGSIDSSFGDSGEKVTHIENGSTIRALALQPDGKIVAAGDIYDAVIGRTHGGILRYNANGSLDTSFGSNGILSIYASRITYIYGLALQADGKIVITGFFSSAGGTLYDIIVYRFNANGSTDTSFGTDGVVLTDFAGDHEVANSVVIQPDGKIIVTGVTHTIPNSYIVAVVRYLADGSLDPSFGSGGKLSTLVGAGLARGQVAMLQPDGKIVIAGSASTTTIEESSTEFAIIRYETNGDLDTNFGSGGMTTTAVSNDSDYIKSAFLAPDGKIVVSGSTQGNSNFTIARYNTDGSLDNNFGTNGLSTLAISTSANAMAMQPDGKIIFVGNFSSSLLTIGRLLP